jgi:hypothetical protein
LSTPQVPGILIDEAIDRLPEDSRMELAVRVAEEMSVEKTASTERPSRRA